MDSITAEALNAYAGKLQQSCLKTVRGEDGRDIAANKAIYERGMKLGRLEEKLKDRDSLDPIEYEALEDMRSELSVANSKATTNPDTHRPIYALAELDKDARKFGVILARQSTAASA